MTHLFVLWLALFAAQLPAAQSAQPPASTAPSTLPPDQATPTTPGTDASVTHQVGGSVTGPKILYQPEPQYTEIARHQRITGVVTLSFIVDTQGDPVNVRVIKSIADTVAPKQRTAALTLDQAAIDTVKQYRFTPAMQDGKPIPVYLSVMVKFEFY